MRRDLQFLDGMYCKDIPMAFRSAKDINIATMVMSYLFVITKYCSYNTLGEIEAQSYAEYPKDSIDKNSCPKIIAGWYLGRSNRSQYEDVLPNRVEGSE